MCLPKVFAVGALHFEHDFVRLLFFLCLFFFNLFQNSVFIFMSHKNMAMILMKELILMNELYQRPIRFVYFQNSVSIFMNHKSFF